MKDSTLTHMQNYNVFLTAKRYSKSTIAQYSSILKTFLGSFKKSASNITANEITEYISKLRSQSAMAQTRGALMNFYTHVIGQKNKFDRIPFPKKEKTLPVIMSTEEIVSKLRAIKNLKHRTILSLIYNTGIRAAELTALRVTDVNGERLTIHIHAGKGAKDRVLPISKYMLDLLREYFLEYNPKTFLFEGQKGRYSYTSLRNICTKHMDTNPHNLRHCNATHLRESGLDISDIGNRLGHNSLKTTMIYNHVATTHSPITVSI